VQLLFDRALFEHAEHAAGRDGLAWGWSDPETARPGKTTRWAYTSCALNINGDSSVSIEGHAVAPAVVWAKSGPGGLIGSFEIEGRFKLNLKAPAGLLELSTSTGRISEVDPRPLAFIVHSVKIDGREIELDDPPVHQSTGISDREKFYALDAACQRTRAQHDIRLTELRGPFSPGLEDYLRNNVGRYDLVITHNPVFRPAVAAVEQANQSDVPVVMVPHAHLDDDFYHFPDVLESVVNSDLVLASPRSCCDFYRDKGATVSYLPAGIDTAEEFTSEDTAAFDSLCPVDEPFVLVLGRKAGAKGYRQVIEAVERLAARVQIHLVMIGPDDDGVPIRFRHATYLGRQPRNVVRGALMRSRAVVNMSASESFGIVILEAWMAGKPVVVNRNCPAFHDLAIDGENALMVDDTDQLETALARLWRNEDLCRELGSSGRKRAESYDWSKIGADFVGACEALIAQTQRERGR
jgi:glycosyltransferase involved in cell wall biosynthesis